MMSDTRYISSSIPHDISYRHRLNIPFRQRKSIIRDRPKIKTDLKLSCESLNGSSINSPLTQSMNKSYFSMPVFDNDAEFEEYLDAELGESSVKAEQEDTVVEVYVSACKKYDVIPNKCIKMGLLKQTLKCHFLNLSYEDCKSICCAVYNNRYTEKLDFKQNGMGPLPAPLFAEVITESSFLTHITISHNALKSNGARVICEAVCDNKMIRSLDLSGNGLVEKDGEFLEHLIKSSKSLRELYLSHNDLMNDGAKMVAKALETTYTLRILDLSWNHIRLNGAVAIGDALAKNASIETINLAWNGFHLDGAKSVSDALKKNTTLENLDLSCNRMSEYCVAQILEGLSKNSTLEVLSLGQNHITTKGAFTILEHLNEYKDSAIRVLDLGKQEVDDKFVELYNKMKNEREIKIVHGEVWKKNRTPMNQSGPNDDEVALMCCNPLLVLMECMRLQNLRLIDFFNRLDTDKSNLICINELCDGMLKVGIPIRRGTLLKLLYKLDADKNELLDYGEMVEAQNKHRKYMRKVLANAELDLGRTEVGKVIALLRKLMDRNFIMKKDDVYTKQNRRQKSRNSSARSDRASSAKTITTPSADTDPTSDLRNEVLLDKNSSSSHNKLSCDLSESLYQGLQASPLQESVHITLRPPSGSSGESGMYSRPDSGSSNGSCGRVRIPNISNNANLVNISYQDPEYESGYTNNTTLFAKGNDLVELKNYVATTAKRNNITRGLSTVSLCSITSSIQ